MTPDFLALGAIWYIVFLFSTACHEGAHSLVAKREGDPTASLGGQATLNPLPHIRREPIGTVVLPIVTYLLPPHWMMGYASAPYDPAWQQRYPHRAARMALAGPAANFTLAIVAGLAIRIGMAAGFFQQPEFAGFTHVTEATAPGFAGFAAILLSVLFVLNILLGTFNLLPVPPLDGHTGVTLLMSEAAANRFLESTRHFGLLGIMLAWVVYGRIFDFIFQISLAVLYAGSHAASL